jgi:dTMP kinase
VFVTLEGIDRSGKTTQAALLARALGPDSLLLREPGGTPLGERVRELLLDPALELGPAVELLLFSAARAALCGEVIGPAMEAGGDVVCDRFIDSTAAYQGGAGGLGIDHVEQFNAVVVRECIPDLTILLRIDPEEAERRGQQRLQAGEADGTDRYEGAGIDYQRAVADAYDELSARHSDRIVVVDGTGGVEEVHGRVMEALNARAAAGAG